MSKPMRLNPEGHSSRWTEMAWGCVPPGGWVPYPRKIPRRHPLLDTVGRIDDPCDRPSRQQPDWSPKPAFKPPREGYPNDICDISQTEGSANSNNSVEVPANAVVSLAADTPQGVQFNVPVIGNYAPCNDDTPTVDECCAATRSLDKVREKVKQIGPLEEREAGHCAKFYRKGSPCNTSCGPLVPKYPCRGVIDTLPEPWLNLSEEQRCRPVSLWSGEDPGDWRDKKPIDGWEFIDKCRTCDYHPIDKELPSRFNNPAWFKGYGCERLYHPFYLTTAYDYGRFGPNPHTMTQLYRPRSSKFTEILGVTGMYRNRSLNTGKCR